MPGKMAERIGEASGAQVATYIMSRPNVKEAIASVTNAARWVSIVAKKVDTILTPFVELAEKADGKGGLIKALFQQWSGAKSPEEEANTHSLIP